jgi:hypothetical protein
MDNRVDLPGYKYYVDPRTGERPAVYVAFLDLVPDPDSTVNGVTFSVTDEDLARLDQRERNYERRVVIDAPRTYAYFGTEAARARFSTGPTVIARSYFDLVPAEFADSTDEPPVPIRDLERVDLDPLD